MNNIRNIILLVISLLSFLMVSVCLFAMYFIETETNANTSNLSLICGIVFWLFTIVGILLQVFISFNIKSWYKRSRLYKLRFKRPRIGLLGIFNNVPAVISDMILLLSLIAFIWFMFVDTTNIVCYILLSALSMSFSAHCIFNGKNYYYIVNYGYINAQLKKWRRSK